MYTVIFVSQPYNNEDDYSKSTDGSMTIKNSNSKLETNKIINELINDYYHKDNKNTALNRLDFGDFGLVVLLDGCVLQEFNMNNIDYSDLTSPVKSTDYFDIKSIDNKVSKNISNINKFAHDFKLEEVNAFRKLKTMYQEIEMEKHERRQLSILLEKYPDMGGR
ncbi:hypothetical protein ACQ27_gp021 [Klebsiella phage K64-1]|uniref:hypothetical protein n=1 Tax=Klebsiella phage K64-1 TaxID=1439894 RepID=UPI00248C11BD|nr:hypothetical protein ACQ27_gp021 [Klebsiella phage K64-1]